jgi:hypothetical protein
MGSLICAALFFLFTKADKEWSLLSLFTQWNGVTT